MPCRRKRQGPQLLITTANAATQRLLTPFRIRQLTRRVAAGERIDREALIGQLNALGYQRADAVAEAGEYAVRGSLIDLFPAGEQSGLRLDFFGDEIESMRRFDPADQRSTDRRRGFTLLPASEALLDEESIKRFRSRYRETFGAAATGDPLYQAVSDGRRMGGMEHWLPLFEERLTTLFDHLGDNDLIVRDGGADGALDGAPRRHRRLLRQPRADDGRRAGQLSPARADTLYLPKEEWDAAAIAAADPPRLALPRAGERAHGRRSTSSRRAISLRSARSRPISTRPSRPTSPRSGRAAARSCSQATAAARANGSTACSRITASSR